MEQKTRRVPEIELMKAIAIIGMVYVHVLECSLGSFTNIKELPGMIPYTLLEFIGGIPAVGAFMFAMGWGASHSVNATPRTYVSRAWKFALLTFYINFLCDFLPGILDPETFGTIKDYPWGIIDFNIYSFAALFMLFFALMKKLEGKRWIRGIISIVIVLAALVADIFVKPETYKGNQWIATLMGIFVRENDFNWYPLIPWAAFPVAGYWAGILYKKWNNRVRFGLASLAAGAVLFTVSFFVLRAEGTPMAALNPGGVTPYDYYAPTIWNVVCAFGLLSLEYALTFGIMTLTKGNLHPFFGDLSRNVMWMFLVQWIFIMPFYPALHRNTNVWVNTVLGTVLFVVIYITVKLLRRWLIKPGRNIL